MARSNQVRRQQSHAFKKVRADHAAETAEDYVEAVSDIVHALGECRVKHLVEHMGVTHVTVSRTIARLEAEGLVETEPYKPIRLTAAGERLAARSRRRHQIVLEFLRALGVTDQVARQDAEGIEHHVSESTLDRMEAFTQVIAAAKVAPADPQPTPINSEPEEPAQS